MKLKTRSIRGAGATGLQVEHHSGQHGLVPILGANAAALIQTRIAQSKGRKK